MIKKRSDQEMLNLIMDFAIENDDVRAVILNGSRANSNIERDIYQDFDIVYVMRKVRPYVEGDRSWLERFGTICVKQEPDSGGLFDDVYEPDLHYTFLMQFDDLNRIDLSLNTLEYYLPTHGSDTLTMVLLDKDNVLPPLAESNDSGYWVQKPTAVLFRCCCNEFWWCTPYIGKGLCRNELLFAMDMINDVVRPMLHMMLKWYVGIDTDFSLSIGKCNKFIFKYLPKELAEGLTATYPHLDLADMWRSVDVMMDVMDLAAIRVAEVMGFQYNIEESDNVRLLLKRMRNQEFEC